MIKFGHTRVGKNREEVLLFDHPYMTMEVKPMEIGKVNKFHLKNGVRELLEFGIRENRISWMFDETGDNEFYLINVSSVAREEVDPVIIINLGLDFNSKPLFEKLEKIMDLDTTQENHFYLIKAEPIQGFPRVKIIPIDPSSNQLKNDREVLENMEKIEISPDLLTQETII